MKLSRCLKTNTFLLTSAVMLFACNKSENITTELTGLIQMEITDAPIDDQDIVGAFVTISEIIVHGDSNLLDEGHTIDLLAYQSGNTKTLGVYSLPVGTYDHLELVLDLQNDAFGNSPGCYVSTKDGRKHNLYPSTKLTTSLTLAANNLVVESMKKTNVVLDFDLRKIIRSGSSSEIKYQFVDDNLLEQGIRALCKDKTGAIKGSFINPLSTDNKIIVFAYLQGTYNQSRELRQTLGAPSFQLAINSASVSEEGDFIIPFLEKGNYQLIFAAYKKSGSAVLKGIVEANGSSGVDLGSIFVEAGNTVTINGSLLQMEPI